jgi:hypothetical protein
MVAFFIKVKQNPLPKNMKQFCSNKDPFIAQSHLFAKIKPPQTDD